MASVSSSRQRGQGTLAAAALPLLLVFATAACVNAARPLPTTGRRLAQNGIYLAAVLGNGDYTCPQGLRMVTYEEATAYSALICAKLSAMNTLAVTWSTSRLANGGSFDGPGMACRVRQTEPRTDLATTLCVPGVQGTQPLPTPSPTPAPSFSFGVPQPSPSPKRSPSPSPSPSPATGCVDKVSYCNMYVNGNLCNSAIIGVSARDVCAKSCGFCSAPVPSPVPSPQPTPSPALADNGNNNNNGWISNFLIWGSNPNPVPSPDPAPLPVAEPSPVPSPIPSPTPSPVPSPLPVQAFVNPTPSGDWMGDLLRLVNDARRQAGQGALCYNAKLTLAAQQQSDSGNYGHTWALINNLNYDWGALGQNIARGQTSVQQVFDAWMNSPTHRENILSPDYTQMGAGWNRGAAMWTQNFGASETEPCM